jgi:hypothetical protein
VTVGNAPKQAGFLERIGSRGAGRHPACLLQGVYRDGVQDAVVGRGFLLHRFAPLLPGSDEVGQRELSSFIRIFGNLGEAARYNIGSRPGSDDFAFKLIGKRDQPALDFGVAAHPGQLMALLGLIA